MTVVQIPINDLPTIPVKENFNRLMKPTPVRLAVVARVSRWAQLKVAAERSRDESCFARVSQFRGMKTKDTQVRVLYVGARASTLISDSRDVVVVLFFRRL